MAITISNRLITPYSSKDDLKVIWGDTQVFEFTLPSPHQDGDRYMLGVDQDRVVYPPSRPLCAYTTAYTVDGNALTMTLTYTTGRLRDFVCKLRKPTPIYIQLDRVRNGKCETLLLDTLLALPSVLDSQNTVVEGDPLEQLLDAKMDKPYAEGQPGEVLSLDADGKPVWRPEQEIPEKEQADWDESDSTAVSYIKHKPVISEVGHTGEYGDLLDRPALKPVATSGSYEDLTDKPHIPVDPVQADYDESDSAALDYIKHKPDLSVYSLVTETGAKLSMSIDGDYVLSVGLLDKDGGTLDTKTIDLPLESMIVNASYSNGVLTLTLQNGNTVDVDISDIVSGLVPDTRTVNGHALSADVTVTAGDLGLATVATTGSYDDLLDKPAVEQADWDESDSEAASYIRNKPDLGIYVVKETGKGLSTNDFTDGDKAKLGGIEDGAEVNVQSDWDQSDSADDSYIRHKPDLAAVATSGSYNDLTDKPVIPVQAQADWDESDSDAASYIRNKPAIPAAQVNTNWDESDSSSPAYLLNRPNLEEVPYFCVEYYGEDVASTSMEDAFAFTRSAADAPNPSIEYSYDKTHWSDYTFPVNPSTSDASLWMHGTAHRKVWFRAKALNDMAFATNYSLSKGSAVLFRVPSSVKGEFRVSGDINTLLTPQGGEIAYKTYQFACLFYGAHVSDFSGLVFPNTYANLNTYCYSYMFNASTLVYAPECILPSGGTLPNSAMIGMFMACTNLRRAPMLSKTGSQNSPATVTASGTACMSYMFRSCAMLEQGIKETILSPGSSALYGMHFGCDKLKMVGDPLCIRPALPGSSCTVTIEKVGTPNVSALQWSYDGITWVAMSAAESTPAAVSFGDYIYPQIYFRRAPDPTTYYGTTFNKNFSNYLHFVITGNVVLSGNIMSLLDPTCRLTEMPNVTESGNYTFGYLFYNCTTIVDASKLKLPSATVGYGAYYSMFRGCTALKAAPELPATTLGTYCYGGMFRGCTALKEAPRLPAYSLADYCYYAMFQDCQSLIKIEADFANVATDSLSNWLSGISQAGCLYKYGNVSQNSDYGLPSNWRMVSMSQPARTISFNNSTVTDYNWASTNPSFSIYVYPYSSTLGNTYHYTFAATASTIGVMARNDGAYSTAGQISYSEVVMDVPAGTDTFVKGTSATTGRYGVDVVDQPTPGYRNVCVVRFEDNTARLYVVDRIPLDTSDSSTSV